MQRFFKHDAKWDANWAEWFFIQGLDSQRLREQEKKEARKKFFDRLGIGWDGRAS